MSDRGLASDCCLVPERTFVPARYPARASQARTTLTLFDRPTA